MRLFVYKVSLQLFNLNWDSDLNHDQFLGHIWYFCAIPFTKENTLKINDLFTELCIRFADDFNHTLDDWKPNTNDPNLMNLCLVTEGSYEVCTQTTKALKVRYYL